jgi:hypothetical protein
VRIRLEWSGLEGLWSFGGWLYVACKAIYLYTGRIPVMGIYSVHPFVLDLSLCLLGVV